MRSPLSFILAVILLITCSGCFWSVEDEQRGYEDRGQGGYGDQDRGERGDRDRGGHDDGDRHDDRRGNDEHR
jgi:hypothetical protein